MTARAGRLGLYAGNQCKRQCGVASLSFFAELIGTLRQEPRIDDDEGECMLAVVEAEIAGRDEE